MAFRMLQSLQRAMPILLRHLDGYIDLAEQDWSAAKLLAKERLRNWVALLVSSIIAVAAVFVFVIAAAWDTEYRLLTIGSMAGVSAIVAVSAALRLKRNRNERAFDALRREWEQDRALVNRLLSENRSA
jgi:uncharacterized membrane protein YqjE